MPSRKSAEGEYKDIAHPINSTTRDRLQTTIIEEYEKVLVERPE
jgi:stage V sporulation protein G